MKTQAFQFLRDISRKRSLVTWLIAALPLSLPAQSTVLFEGFEGAFPEDNGWSVGDSNPSGSAAYWNDVDINFGGEGTHTGNWKGYCAGYGYAGSTAAPTYQDYMAAFMRKTVDLTGYNAAKLRFWHRLPSIESGYDSVGVYVETNLLWSDSNTNAAWMETTIDLTPYVGGTHGLGFWFFSDVSVTREGWYLDDIQVTGYTPPVNDQCSGAITLSPGGSWTMDLGGATSTGDPVPACQGNFGKGVWFRVVAPADGALDVSTCGSDFDTVLQVFTGVCGGLLPVASGCNDDNGPLCSGLQASAVVQAGSGTNYYLLAGGYAGATGALEIAVQFHQRLSIRQNTNGTLTLEWPLSGTLQAAPYVIGPWQDVIGATSPYSFVPTSQAMFFHIRQ